MDNVIFVPWKFLSTLSLRRATTTTGILILYPLDFYPRSPCGERPNSLLTNVVSSADFYPRSPCGERRVLTGGLSCDRRNFYPRSPCGERLNSAYGALDGASISIHALLAESDSFSAGRGSDTEEFLSTLSLRRATPPFAR